MSTVWLGNTFCATHSLSLCLQQSPAVEHKLVGLANLMLRKTKSRLLKKKDFMISFSEEARGSIDAMATAAVAKQVCLCSVVALTNGQRVVGGRDAFSRQLRRGESSGKNKEKKTRRSRCL